MSGIYKILTMLMIASLSSATTFGAGTPENLSDTTQKTSDYVVQSEAVTQLRLDSLQAAVTQPLNLNIGTPRLEPPTFDLDSLSPVAYNPEVFNKKYGSKGINPSIYSLPYSFTGRSYDWRRLWINTAVLTGCFVGTLLFLECLPEGATDWNKKEIDEVPLGRRWHDHVFEHGPEWDHNSALFNYVLHPYAGAVYFMSARSVGFNFWQSLLYSAIISDIGWEFGIEAFMEDPSIQDLIITPVVGSAIGEGFYILKRHLVANDYRLFGSKVVGNIVAFLIDPVNEVVGIFDHNPARVEARRLARERGEGISLVPMVSPGFTGFTLTATF